MTDRGPKSLVLRSCLIICTKRASSRRVFLDVVATFGALVASFSAHLIITGSLRMISLNSSLFNLASNCLVGVVMGLAWIFASLFLWTPFFEGSTLNSSFDVSRVYVYDMFPYIHRIRHSPVGYFHLVLSDILPETPQVLTDCCNWRVVLCRGVRCLDYVADGGDLVLPCLSESLSASLPFDSCRLFPPADVVLQHPCHIGAVVFLSWRNNEKHYAKYMLKP